MRAKSGLLRRERSGAIGLDELSTMLFCRLRAKIACRAGQGTTEYAILVGVLVVVAILAIGLFKPRLEQLWQAIADGINGL